MNNTDTYASDRHADEVRPWWRYPMVWLVIGGPLTVVVAAILTAVIAIRNPDPVVAQDYYRRGLELSKPNASMTPALQARNHAATPAQAASAVAPGH